MSYRPDFGQAYIALSIPWATPEARLLVRALMEKEARNLGIDLPTEVHACAPALVCAWTSSDRASELATTWARTLLEPSAGDFYGVRQEVLNHAQALEEHSFVWRLETTLAALGRITEFPPEDYQITQARGARLLRGLSLSGFQVEVVQARQDAHLEVALPGRLDELAARLAELRPPVAAQARPAAARPVDDAPSASESSAWIVQWEDPEAPATALALVGFRGPDPERHLPDGTAPAPALSRVGLEVVRARYNARHQSVTGVVADWFGEGALPTAPRLTLSGPAGGIPSALDLLREEFDRTISAGGLPSDREVSRALVALQAASQTTPAIFQGVSCGTLLARKTEPREVAAALRSIGQPVAIVLPGTSGDETSLEDAPIEEETP